MKKTYRMILLATATILATAGLTVQAENLTKKAVPDLNTKGEGSMAQSIWCYEPD